MAFSGIHEGQQIEDINGVPVSGAKVFFYKSDTLTEQAAYTDKELTTPAANPVIADSTGRYSAYLNPLLNYDVVIKSADEGTTYASYSRVGGGAGSSTTDPHIVVDTLAELQALTGTSSESVIRVLGRSSADDGYEGEFRWVSGDQSTNVTNDPGSGVWVGPDSDSTGTTGAWKRIFAGDTNMQWFGAVGDATTDDTTAVQRAMDYMEYIGQQKTDSRTLFVPLGKYKLTSTITVTEGFAIRGEGVTMFRDRPFSSDLVEAGSWFYFAHTGKGITFGGQGASLVRGTGIISELGTYRDQPTPAASWAPTAHDYDFYIDDGNWDFHHIGMLNPTKGICVDGASGRCELHEIQMDAFDEGIYVARATDVCRIDNVQCWPFWYDDNIDSVTYIQEYKRANLDVIKLARVDNPSVTDIFAIYSRCLVYFVQTADGQASRVQAANWGADSSARLFEVASSVTAGIQLDLVNAYFFGYPALAGTQGILISGSDSDINLANVRLERIDRNGIRVETGTGNTVRIANLFIDDWNNSGSGFPGIEVAASNTVTVATEPEMTNGNGAADWASTGTVNRPPMFGYEGGVTSDGSGDIVVTHGYTRTPTIALAEIFNNANIDCRVHAKTATTFTLRLYDSDTGSALASTAINVMWQVQ